MPPRHPSPARRRTPRPGAPTLDPAHFLNRELSWLEFNRRVLAEAQDPSQPLLERVKFLGITASNLDEFFEIRVAGLKQQIEAGSTQTGPDGLSASDTFDAIRTRVTAFVAAQYQLWEDELLPALRENDIHIHTMKDLPPRCQAWVGRHFKHQVLPVLTPRAVDASHPFPQLANRSHNLLVLLRRSGTRSGTFHGIVPIPRILPRLIRIPATVAGDGWHFVYLKSVIAAHLAALFPGLDPLETAAFRVTRNSDLYIDEEEAENLLRTIEQELRNRNRGAAVRLEVERGCSRRLEAFLQRNFHVGPEDTYRVGTPVSFQHVMPLNGLEGLNRLKDRPFIPVHDLALPPECDPFEVLRKQDVLLHHPYETFDSLIDLLDRAANDPDVLAIKMTLYRTSGDSPLVKSLITAAANGKEVTALVELKARFDEANNIQWAKQLEDAGVNVFYGVVGLKTHCKLLLLVRREGAQLRRYAHLGTGNYHPRTARLYTDLSLLTARADLTAEVATVFNTLTGLSGYAGLRHLMVAPFDLAQGLHAAIEQERRHARAGRPGRLVIKVNSLVDEEIITALYAASRDGVQIDLIIRGICCLRPGVPGLSDNIRVRSIVGRFLEHSRIYYFGNAGKPEIYLGSADWMPRNFYRRIEVAFPILDPVVKRHIESDILPLYLKDNVKARLLQPDGTYLRLQPGEAEEPVAAQYGFREIARYQREELSRRRHKDGPRLTPLRAAKTKP